MYIFISSYFTEGEAKGLMHFFLLFNSSSRCIHKAPRIIILFLTLFGRKIYTFSSNIYVSYIHFFLAIMHLGKHSPLILLWVLTIIIKIKPRSSQKRISLNFNHRNPPSIMHESNVAFYYWTFATILFKKLWMDKKEKINNNALLRNIQYKCIFLFYVLHHFPHSLFLLS